MFDKIVEAIQSGRSPLLFTAIAGEACGSIAIQDGENCCGDTTLLRPIGEQPLPCVIDDVLCERITTPPELILCGAGHVSVHTAKIAKLVGFSVTVIDDRAEFANRDRFPDADRILVTPFEEALETIRSSNAYYVIVTRGHRDDQTCLGRILTLPFAYCGMIGSRTKTQIVFDEMRRLGFSEAQIARVHAPIGLPIGAQTPEEIAVCIVGEMIREKNSTRRGSEWDAALCDAILHAKKPYAMVTLIDKHGSAPRAAGARMIVFPDGTIVSSIGGGFGEFEASQHAVRMLREGVKQTRYTCRMNNTDAAKSGMICGGTIDILIQITED